MNTSIHPLDQALAASISGDPDESERILRTLDPNDARVCFNLGWHECRHGRWNKGLSMMDAGRFLNCFGLPRLPGTIWRDESLAGKTLLFRCEGGFGDQILNFRFAYDFADMGARVLVSCAPQLKALFNRHGFVCIDNEVVAGAHYDYWIPAMSAAHVLGYDKFTLPHSEKPPYSPRRYLHAEARDLIGEGLKVGLRWSGNPKFEHEQHRRFNSQLMLDLASTPGCTFYSLQRDENLIDDLPFIDLRHDLSSWEATAEIVAGLDLVITSCTSIAHLAGALGVPTWVIAPVLPYYTWAEPGDRSVWYDSVTLFRQTTYGDWKQPFQDVQRKLNAVSSNAALSPTAGLSA